MAADTVGNCYVSSGFHGQATIGRTLLYSGARDDMFVAKFGSNGVPIWAIQSSNAFSFSASAGIALHGSSNVFAGLDAYVGSGVAKVFLAKLSSAGSLIWKSSTNVPGAESAVATESNGNPYSVGNGLLRHLAIHRPICNQLRPPVLSVRESVAGRQRAVLRLNVRVDGYDAERYGCRG